MSAKLIHLSSRQSDLAKLQSYLVAEALKKKSDLKIQFHFKESLGDINLTDPLWKIPEKGVFTEDFNHDLLLEKTDLVVHSWKDLPTDSKPGLSVVATLPRADQRDLLLVKKNCLDRILKTKKINLFSSSPRRFYNLGAFLKNHFPYGLNEINFESVRGNIPTRLRKLLEADQIDGLILAKAALDRLIQNDFEDLKTSKLFISEMLQQMNWMVLPLSENPNAAAQGSIAIEIKADRADIRRLVDAINHSETFSHTEKERKVLSSYGGGCHQKIGVSSLPHKFGEVLFLKGETDKGEILNEKKLTHPKQELIFKKFDSTQIWSESMSHKYFDRVALDYKLENSKNSLALFITKAENLPKNTNVAAIWVAGTSTWKKCADQGIWVNGCQDSLGEDYQKRIETLIPKETHWIKLTHAEAPVIDGYSNVSNYKLVRNTLKFDFENKKCFFLEQWQFIFGSY